MSILSDPPGFPVPDVPGTVGRNPAAAVSTPPPGRSARWLAGACAGATGVSIAAMIAAGVMGPSAVVPGFAVGTPWPPWFRHDHPTAVVVSVMMWAAVLAGGAGLSAGLLAVRRGWRPRPAPLIAGAVIAVLALLVVPPVGSTDMLDYAAYGRITALGHSPYQMTPLQLKQTGDPVGGAAPQAWQTDPSVYGPLATASEWAAAELGGTSGARILFWLKAWNALAFLAVVLALDRLTRSDPARRARAHLLWSVNPLMLLAVMAGGHVDGLSAALGFGAVAVLGPGAVLGGDGARRPSALRWLLAGLLTGVAAAVKAPMLLVAAGLGWAARRSPRAVCLLGLGLLAVLVPCYLVAGRPAVSAVAGRASGTPTADQPWQLLPRIFEFNLTGTGTDIAGAAGFVVLAVIMLIRVPGGRAGSRYVAPAFALTLAWLITTPQQHPWYDAAVFPLLALLPATRLDWVAVARLVVASLADLPGVAYYLQLQPGWLSEAGKVITTGVAPLVLACAGLVVIWLYLTGRWGSAGPAAGQAAGPPEMITLQPAGPAAGYPGSSAISPATSAIPAGSPEILPRSARHRAT
jgi:hypothetical protein